MTPNLSFSHHVIYSHSPITDILSYRPQLAFFVMYLYFNQKFVLAPPLLSSKHTLMANPARETRQNIKKRNDHANIL